MTDVPMGLHISGTAMPWTAAQKAAFRAGLRRSKRPADRQRLSLACRRSLSSCSRSMLCKSLQQDPHWTCRKSFLSRVVVECTADRL